MSDAGRRIHPSGPSGDLEHGLLIDQPDGMIGHPPLGNHSIRSIPTDELVRLVYDELRAVAARMMKLQRPGHTLQPTALVNEALLRIVASGTVLEVKDRTHLLAATVQAMGQILIDSNRRRRARKRGGGWNRHPLEAYLDHLEQRHQIRFEALY